MGLTQMDGKNKEEFLTERGFNSFVSETKGVVLAAVYKHLAGRFNYATDDVVQETYLRAYRSLQAGKIEDLTKINSWLYVTAKNEAYRMNFRLEREERKAGKAGGAGAATPGANPTEQAAIRSMEGEFLQRQIDNLPEKYRQVVALRSEGLAVQEVADQLGLALGTVKSRASRGLGILRSMLRDSGYSRALASA